MRRQSQHLCRRARLQEAGTRRGNSHVHHILSGSSNRAARACVLQASIGVTGGWGLRCRKTRSGSC
eukprot:11155161-Lingulodinium_polyedra.AAC.1